MTGRDRSRSGGGRKRGLEKRLATHIVAEVETLIGAVPEVAYSQELFEASDSLTKLSRTLHSIVEGLRRDAAE